MSTENSKQTQKKEAKTPLFNKGKIKITGPVSGKFKLPYNIGQVLEVPKDIKPPQATELLETQYAQKV